MPPKLHFQSGATLRPNFACARLFPPPWPFPASEDRTTKGLGFMSTSVESSQVASPCHNPESGPSAAPVCSACGRGSSAWNSGEALRSASSRKPAPNTASSSPLASEQVGRINRHHSQRTWLPSANETLHTPRPSNPMLASAMQKVADGLNQRGRLAVILGLQDACDGSGQPEAFHQIPPTLQFLTLNPINSKP